MPDPHASLAVQGLQGPDETIQQDLPCSRCGYNLRGLTLNMACPECSTPVGSSVHGDLLAYADPDWLDKLRRGTLLKLWSMLLAVIAVLVVYIAFKLGIRQQIELILIELILSLPTTVLGLWAVFLITAQEPRISLQEDSISLRRIVRVCAVIGMFEELSKNAVESLGDRARTVAVVVYAIAMSLSIVALFGEFVYYRRFARRIPDESLARSTTFVMWGLGVSMTVIGVGLAVGLAVAGPSILAGGAGGGPAGAGVVGMFCLVCAGGVGALVFAICNIVLLFRYKRAFTVAAASAQAAEAGARLG